MRLIDIVRNLFSGRRYDDDGIITVEVQRLPVIHGHIFQGTSITSDNTILATFLPLPKGADEDALAKTVRDELSTAGLFNVSLLTHNDDIFDYISVEFEPIDKGSFTTDDLLDSAEKLKNTIRKKYIPTAQPEAPSPKAA